MVTVNDMLVNWAPANERSMADILDKDKYDRLVIGTKKWLAYVLHQSFSKYATQIFTGLIPGIHMDYPYPQQKVPVAIIYGASGLTPANRIIGYNRVQSDVTDETGNAYNVRYAQYSMNIAIDFWGKSTFERDAGLSILVQELWMTRRIELGTVGITITDVQQVDSKETKIGEDNVYGTSVTVSLLVELMYFESVETLDLVLDIRQEWADIWSAPVTTASDIVNLNVSSQSVTP